MDGVRKASAHDIVFQAREGSPELNCCSVNGARGFGMISDWALMRAGDGLLVNWYGPPLSRPTSLHTHHVDHHPGNAVSARTARALAR